MRDFNPWFLCNHSFYAMKTFKSFLQQFTNDHSNFSQDELKEQKQRTPPVDQGDTPPSEKVPDAFVKRDLENNNCSEGLDMWKIFHACDLVETELQSSTFEEDYAYLDFNYDDFPDETSAELVLVGQVAESLSGKLDLTGRETQLVVCRVKMKHLAEVQENGVGSAEHGYDCKGSQPLDGDTLAEKDVPDGGKNQPLLIQPTQSATEPDEATSVYSEHCSDAQADDSDLVIEHRGSKWLSWITAKNRCSPQEAGSFLGDSSVNTAKKVDYEDAAPGETGSEKPAGGLKEKLSTFGSKVKSLMQIETAPPLEACEDEVNHEPPSLAQINCDPDVEVGNQGEPLSLELSCSAQDEEKHESAIPEAECDSLSDAEGFEPLVLTGSQIGVCTAECEGNICRDEEPDVLSGPKIVFGNSFALDDHESSQVDKMALELARDECCADTESLFSSDYQFEKWSPWTPVAPRTPPVAKAAEESVHSDSSACVSKPEHEEDLNFDSRKTREENLSKDKVALRDDDYLQRYPRSAFIPKRIIASDASHSKKQSRLRRWVSSLKTNDEPCMDHIPVLLGIMVEDQPETDVHDALAKGEMVEVLAYDDVVHEEVWLLVRPLVREEETGFMPASSVRLHFPEELTLEKALKDFKVPRRCCFWLAQTELLEALDEYWGGGDWWAPKSHVKKNIQILSNPSNWKNLGCYFFAKQYPYLGLGKQNFLAHRHFEDAKWNDTPEVNRNVPRIGSTCDTEEETDSKKSMFKKGFKNFRQVFRRGLNNSPEPMERSQAAVEAHANEKTDSKRNQFKKGIKQCRKFLGRESKKLAKPTMNDSPVGFQTLAGQETGSKMDVPKISFKMLRKIFRRESSAKNFRWGSENTFGQEHSNKATKPIIGHFQKGSKTDADDKGFRIQRSEDVNWLAPKNSSTAGHKSKLKRFKKRFNKLFKFSKCTSSAK